MNKVRGASPPIACVTMAPRRPCSPISHSTVPCSRRAPSERSEPKARGLSERSESKGYSSCACGARAATSCASVPMERFASPSRAAAHAAKRKRSSSRIRSGSSASASAWGPSTRRFSGRPGPGSSCAARRFGFRSPVRAPRSSSPTATADSLRATAIDLRAAIEADLEQLARVELIPRLHELASRHGLNVGAVTIRNQRSRWGSCARNGNIALNFRLVQMPHAHSRLRADPRADAPSPAESFAPLLAPGRSRLPGVSRRGAMAADLGPVALLNGSVSMVLKGQRCLVRPWRSLDAEALVRHANNLEVARHLRDKLSPSIYARRRARFPQARRAGSAI